MHALSVISFKDTKSFVESRFAHMYLLYSIPGILLFVQYMHGGKIYVEKSPRANPIAYSLTDSSLSITFFKPDLLKFQLECHTETAGLAKHLQPMCHTERAGLARHLQPMCHTETAGLAVAYPGGMHRMHVHPPSPPLCIPPLGHVHPPLPSLKGWL